MKGSVMPRSGLPPIQTQTLNASRTRPKTMALHWGAAGRGGGARSPRGGG
eukprot:CAMPEP_0175261534 /NCGR_PEP_ID=MMETSP0093-20121207/40810_1 /TAXON_ID=311494 /ORGANISM="Alexandrium monilatum, Strain CCMP3105" /LENGTH=49 /DNA_ID= /DNA_START= /DNA_END= /DNA_ORIENTATION=